MNLKILVAEDDKNISALTALYLQKEGCQIITCGNGQEALALFAQEKPDMVLLDLMMPGMHGLEVLKEIRSKHSTPVIILTARDEEMDKILGLEIGADDYITKPFSPREMVARVKSLWRRTTTTSQTQSERLVFPGLIIDLNAREILCNQKTVKMTPKEFELLAFLASNPNRVLSRSTLLDRVWDFQGEDYRTVDVHIKRIRQKVSNPHYSYLHTIWGVGYKFEVKSIEDEPDMV